MNRSVVHHTLPETDRREIVISDIHGNFTAYRKILEKAEYSPRADRLILLGDLVEKGEENLSLLQYVMKQKEEGEDLWLIMGNCDFTAKNILYSYRLDFIKKILLQRKNSLIHELAAACGMQPLCETTDMSVYCQEIRSCWLKELCFLNDLPHVLSNSQRIYTHAGIVSEKHFGSDFRETMTFPFFMETEQRFQRPVICGHLPVTEYCRRIADFNVRYDPFRNIYGIDGGNVVKKAGQLNALIFQGNHTSSLYVDLLPEVRARVSTSPANPHPFFITWNRGKIELLQQEKEQSFVRCTYSGRSFWIDNDFIKTENGALKGFDYTNYEMPLRKNDLYSLVHIGKEKVQIKKAGRLGWTWKKNLEL